MKNITFSKDFDKVVEEKQIEEQKIKTAEYKKQQAEQQALQTVITARATADQNLILAEAEAKKQSLLRSTSSADVIALKWIDKWNGQLPVTTLGDKSVPMINLGK